MQINDDFYGSARTTLSNGLEVLPYNMADALNGGDLPFNEEWDLSICPWGIGIGSEIFNVSFPVNDVLDGYNSTFTEMPLFSDTDYYPMMLTVDGTNTTAPGQKTLVWEGRNAYNQSEIINDNPTMYRNWRRIVSHFNYQNLCVVPYIIVVSNSGEGMPADYNTWKTDSYYHNKDISGILFHIYYHNGTYYAANPFNISFNSMAHGIPCEGLVSTYSDDWLDYSYAVTSTSFAGVGTNGEASSYPSGENFNYKAMPLPHGEHWKYYARSTYGGSVSYYPVLDQTILDDDDKILDWLCTQTAYLGTYFVLNSSTLTPDLVLKNNPNVYIGEINESGITTGRYFKGTDMGDLDQTDWIDPWDDTPFDPTRPIDPTPWDTDQTSILETTTGDPSYGTKEFLMTETALQQLLKVLEEFKVGEAEGDIATGYCEKAFGSTDPIESIISVIKYPFDMISNWIGSGTVVNGSDVGSWLSFANAQIPVSIGSGTAPPYTILIPSAHDIYEIQWGSTVWKYGRATLPYFQKFKCFLDYEPYCTASLYIPFCGSVRLDPEVYVAHTVGVEYYVSPLDGTIKAYVLRDNLVIDTLAGNIGTSIEINSSDDLAKANNVNLLNSTIQAQKMTLVKQAASFAVNTGITAAFSPLTAGISAARGAVDMIGSAMLTENALDRLEFQIDTAQTPFKQLQAGGGYLSSCDEWGVRLVAYRPELLSGYSLDSWGAYGHLEGFACFSTGTLASFRGYTVCSDVDLSGVACTSTEKEMIFKLLQSGVFI